MSDQQKTKEQLMQMAAEDLEQLLTIIGELGLVGYRVCLMKINGASHQQCAIRYGVSKKFVRCAWDKCVAKGFVKILTALFFSKEIV